MKHFEKLLTVTGWCASKRVRIDTNRSSIFNTENYLRNYWFQHIEKQILPAGHYVYISNSDIYALAPDSTNAPIYYGWSIRRYDQLYFRHDWFGTLYNAAVFADSNDLDLCFIEQDCLVVGLQEILEFAYRAVPKIAYGYGINSSIFPGWAANSFVFIRHKYLGKFIKTFIDLGWMDYSVTDRRPLEKGWHEAFKDDATFWPFGYDRRRPIDFSLQAYYAQQMTDEDFSKMLQALKMERM
jgi:hypothetical protein